jgi:hypothetical protein
VTGDGVRDRISLSGSWTRKGCRYLLRVNTRTPLRLREGLLEAPDIHPSARLASLFGLARIDRRPGAEVLVALSPPNPRGVEVGVYSLRSGRIRHIPIANRAYTAALFGGGGSGRFAWVSDCWRGPASGLVITSSAEWEPEAAGRVSVSRRLYRIAAGTFVPIWNRHYRVRNNRFPEFRGRSGRKNPPVFQSCLSRR